MSTRRTGSPSGALAEHGPGFRGYLFELGYSASAAKKHLRLLVDLSRWLEREGISADELAAASTEGFFRRRRARGRANLRTPRSLDPLLAYLRALGVIETSSRPVLTDPVEVFIEGYHGYLTGERGLGEGTARFYLHVARLFVSERRGGAGIDWASLRAVDVTGFTTRVCGVRGVSSARQVVCALRCLLRYLRLEGLTEPALDEAVLSVAGSNPSLPRGISSAAVTPLLGSCDRRRPIGRRDYAILMLLCWLGLRGGEVVGLALDDIDWRGWGDRRGRQGRRAVPPAACCRRRSGAGGLPTPGPTPGRGPGRVRAPIRPDPGPGRHRRHPLRTRVEPATGRGSPIRTHTDSLTR
jgi:integrase/recombinase XerD